jgi:hypothetical protein
MSALPKGRFDASEWNPDAREAVERSSDNRAKVLRKAHEAAAYNDWLASEVQEATDDPRPNLPHEDVVAEIDADIAAPAPGRKSAARRSPQRSKRISGKATVRPS